MNSIKHLLFLMFVISAGLGHAQTKKHPPKRNQLMLSMSNGVMINSLNVRNNDVYPNPIHASSALSHRYSLALEFQRQAKSGFIYGVGIGFGNYKQNFDVVYPSFDYVEETTTALDDVSHAQSFRNSCQYVEARLFIGYNLPLNIFSNDDYSCETRLTVSKRVYLAGDYLKSVLRTNYSSNDTVYLYNSLASFTEGFWGNRRLSGLGGPLVTDIYLGFRKNLKSQYINTFNIGMFATHQFHVPGTDIGSRSDIRVMNGHFKNGELVRYDTDFYTNEEVVFGIKVGVGLRF